MDEGLLHKLAVEVGGRFQLTVRVQRQLVKLMQDRNDLIVKNCGGRPIRLVVEAIDRETRGIEPPAVEPAEPGAAKEKP